MQAKRTAERYDQAVVLQDDEASAIQPRHYSLVLPTCYPSYSPLFRGHFRRRLLAHFFSVSGLAHPSRWTSFPPPRWTTLAKGTHTSPSASNSSTWATQGSQQQLSQYRNCVFSLTITGPQVLRQAATGAYTVQEMMQTCSAAMSHGLRCTYISRKGLTFRSSRRAKTLKHQVVAQAAYLEPEVEISTTLIDRQPDTASDARSKSLDIHPMPKRSARQRKSLLKGWRVGVFAAACMMAGAFLVNLIVTICASIYFDLEDVIGDVYTGSCDAVDR